MSVPLYRVEVYDPRSGWSYPYYTHAMTAEEARRNAEADAWLRNWSKRPQFSKPEKIDSISERERIVHLYRSCEPPSW